MKKGLLIIHTGNGKGKTTAALGLAMRAMGQNFKVCMIQFIKGGRNYGEKISAKRFDDLLDFHVMGRGMVKGSKDREADKKMAVEAWQFTQKVLSSELYGLVILDEITYPVKYGFIDEKEIEAGLSNRREGLHVVLTGRNAPQSWIDIADIVTEMKEIRHPLKSGVKAQVGIEF